MSHISTHKHSVQKVDVFCKVAEEAGCKVVVNPTEVRMYGSQRVNNAQASISIPGWRYDIAINAKGEILYDHFGSDAGSMENLHSIMQEYNQESILQELPFDQLDSYNVNELRNGDREVVLEYGT